MLNHDLNHDLNFEQINGTFKTSRRNSTDVNRLFTFQIVFKQNGMNMSNLACGTGSPFMYIFLQTAGIFRASLTMVELVKFNAINQSTPPHSKK